MNIIQTPDAPQAIGPYAQAVAVDGWLFTSGQIPLNAAGELVEGDVTVQTTQVLDNLHAVLTATGGGFDKVVKTTVFLADMNDFAAMNAVYAARFGSHTPARSTVQVARLPRDVKVEIEVVARLA
ncbi:RidA family protein [Rivihabitans pingtungensis]|jgi:2-iminobutanoate/2-iminopropanoate deaminase|uniref:RidA family protein n=1 Tax=Rivihabitans pingtungensis TaxID=1054498 RepID=UPI002FDAF39D